MAPQTRRITNLERAARLALSFVGVEHTTSSRKIFAIVLVPDPTDKDRLRQLQNWLFDLDLAADNPLASLAAQRLHSGQAFVTGDDCHSILADILRANLWPLSTPQLPLPAQTVAQAWFGFRFAGLQSILELGGNRPATTASVWAEGVELVAPGHGLNLERIISNPTLARTMPAWPQAWNTLANTLYPIRAYQYFIHDHAGGNAAILRRLGSPPEPRVMRNIRLGTLRHLWPQAFPPRAPRA